MIPGCIIEQDTDYPGNDITSRHFDTKEACAFFCASTAGGLFWTWNTAKQKCYVKNSDSGRKDVSGAVSGNKLCGTG